MVETQIRARGIKDPNVLAVMEKVRRDLFVPEELKQYAYDDYPLPIGSEQTISQPYIVALMTELLGIDENSKILEIGTGSGYQTAILAEIGHDVYSIEYIESLAASAKERLSHLGYKNVHVIHGDGYKGWPEKALFDAIIVTAAAPYIPKALTHQLKENGRMVIPIGVSFQSLYLVTKEKGEIKITEKLPVRFVPMVHEEDQNNDGNSEKGF